MLSRSFSACVRQRLANSILNPFSLCGLASRSAASAALRKIASCRRLADERGFGLGRSPRLGAHAAQRDARARHLPAGDRDHDRRRRERELVGRPVAQLQIERACFPATGGGSVTCVMRSPGSSTVSRCGVLPGRR